MAPTRRSTVKTIARDVYDREMIATLERIKRELVRRIQRKAKLAAGLTGDDLDLALRIEFEKFKRWMERQFDDLRRRLDGKAQTH